MIDTASFLQLTCVEVERLEAWISAGWILPRDDREAKWFSEVDVARAQLIRELTQDMGVNDEGVAVILDLVDQIHGLRSALRGVQALLRAQPDTVRREILAKLHEALPEHDRR